MGEAVVVLAPDGGGDEQVERGDGLAPGQVVADLQPLGVLVEHGVDDVHEGLVGREEAVASGEQVAFEHAFHGVLAEHLHDAAVGREFAAVEVFLEIFLDPELLADLVDGVELVGGVLVRAEDAEVVHVGLHDVAQINAEGTGVFGLERAGLLELHAVVAEIGQAKGALDASAVGVEVGAHAAVAEWARVRGIRRRTFRGRRRVLRASASASSFRAGGAARDLS